MSFEEDATAASWAAGRFWQALALDDDEAAGPVIVRGSIEQTAGLEPGFAGRFRKATGKTRDECAQMGVSSRVSRCADGSYLVRSVRRKGLGMDVYTEPQWVDASFLIVVRLEGTWQVWGSPDGRPGQEIVGEVNLVPESPFPSC